MAERPEEPDLETPDTTPTVADASSHPDDAAAGRSALRKASWRLLPLIGLGYGIAYMDRTNISLAALKMNDDLHFSATAYGLGAGLFFLSYAALEVPSNVMLMRFGARRWIARIMLTWGLLAMGMTFVRTPVQFYVMRFLLGAAEAGFFPGVVFYLMQWFPAHERGRAISRFYVALPLSSVLMGLAAGALLGLGGHLGLKGWQWLFLAEGLPAVILSGALLLFLPNGPAEAAWLTTDERAWIEHRLQADKTRPEVAADHGVLRALADPRVLLLGVANLCILCSAYALSFSAPILLRNVTHLDASGVGFLIAAVGVLGAVGMITAGWHSDHRGERYLHAAVFLLCVIGAEMALGLSVSAWVVVPAYAIAAGGLYAIQAVFWLIPSDVLQGRSAAGGIAAIGSIGMVGGFIGPYVFGIAKDYTGNFQTGLLWLALPYVVAAAIVLLVRRNARLADTAASPAPAPDPAAWAELAPPGRGS
jgi:ACS family tartrate transporter-like MFS transporter